MELRSLSAAHAPLIAALDAEARGPSAWSTDAWLPYLCPPWAFGAFEGEALLAFAVLDRKSTRLNSSHVAISYAVFCLKKKSTATSHNNVHTTTVTRKEW